MEEKYCLKRYSGNDGSLEAFVTWKHIALDKNSGVRPIEVREVIIIILGRAIITTFRRNILESAGDLQLCAG